MKKLLVIAVVAVVAVLAFAAAEALAQTPVNIVYPVNYAAYPATDGSALITASFGVTCPDGPHLLVANTVSWGFETGDLGSLAFYDQASVQQVYKLPVGEHKLWVQSSCGFDVVYFKIY